MQVEHKSIRSSKGPDEFLNANDYKRMTYTQRVRLFFVPFFFLSNLPFLFFYARSIEIYGRYIHTLNWKVRSIGYHHRSLTRR
jgi:hypothetical protein